MVLLGSRRATRAFLQPDLSAPGRRGEVKVGGDWDHATRMVSEAIAKLRQSGETNLDANNFEGKKGYCRK